MSGWIHAESLEAVNGQPPGSWNFKRDLVVLWNLRWNPFSRQHPIRWCVRYLCRWGPYDPSQLFIAPNRIGDSRIGTTLGTQPPPCTRRAGLLSVQAFPLVLFAGMRQMGESKSGRSALRPLNARGDWTTDAIHDRRYEGLRIEPQLLVWRQISGNGNVKHIYNIGHLFDDNLHLSVACTCVLFIATTACWVKPQPRYRIQIHAADDY
ncbi:uncharacterized protein CIMG_02195 [Coccidioides immitis RS]|uniref:Uncharacterized protein n=4 Tax=Coccidioides immitis TaxID=5501 RepID=J3KKU9_COCIM|nr:uncharacterized protein CIMG_02195 [Coccidioides immitis RS]EAS36841.3 hypothetical protein CIMG_02195 [Coccidioides immitis RS]KMP09746.1 hypothetical protein CIRG_08979 [Coccidioides immitis RMSCC 2394]KMU75107.1 hypothetical protein CISG_04394 [Coccidioides immitis RMSCC 3703]KMU90199.1 hypothetical protein CIHG_08009 [Coccidioides immitis H538.4]